MKPKVRAKAFLHGGRIDLDARQDARREARDAKQGHLRY
jgi:hypothetical protein